MASFNEIIELFNRARAEMFLPPLDVRVEAWEGQVEVSVKGRVARIRVPRRLLGDPEGGPILLWYFRHHLAHMHYCPYNLRTVQTLARAAYEEVRSWSHAHNAVRLFSDLQVDLLYLPLRYKRPPLHLSDEFYSKPKGLEAVRYAACWHVYGDMLRKHKLDRDTSFYGSLLAEVILSSRPWVVKVKAIATVLKRLQDLGRMGELRKRAGSDVPLSEDLEIDFLGEARRAMRGIRSVEEAKEMFEHWLRGRVDVEGLKEELKKAIKGARREREEKVEAPTPGCGEGGEEPELPSSLSKPLRKLGDPEEAIWRALWYRARAEEFMIKYGGRRRRGTWAIYAYPDLWMVEDDIEDLDVESSLEEGPLIPEETTLKPVNLPSPSGEVIVQERAPTVLVVLDTSKSMLKAVEDAAIAAFTAYLSAKHAGGRTAVINFSTKYLAVGWDEPDIRKELAMAFAQGELTILPLGGIKRLISELEPGEEAMIIIVTDCGWQNLREALKFLEDLASRGHRVVVLHIEGWRYPKSVEAVASSRGVTLYRVKEPSMLKYLTLAEVREERQPFKLQQAFSIADEGPSVG
ncbi:MAG: hypothetical protein DRK00_00130 [Thermoprotei archaeon]|nr:MAG: hypothetical protein DRK00_00130 [Thermoprotei archaeon]